MKIDKLLLAPILLILCSCQRFVDITIPPKDKLLATSVFTSNETATSALMGIYVKMMADANNYHIPLVTGYTSDELETFSNNAQLLDMYYNNPKASDAYSNRFWNTAYFYVFQANSIIEGCINSVNLHLDVKQQLIAEAHFIRAFWMYYLVTFFGDIPIVTNTNYRLNQGLERSSKEEVYKQIINDLQLAQEDLNVNYVNSTSRMSTSERIRPNQSAAKALLSRLYLTIGKWQDAEMAASTVIEKVEMYDTVAINQVFLKDNREAIWQLQQPTPRTSNISTWEANNFILVTTPPGTPTFNCSTISKYLLESFELEDLRRSHWIGEYVDYSTTPSKSYYYPSKYKVRFSESTPTEQSTVLRLAEQYLIRAEARNRLGDVEGSLNDLNLIRRRAGLKEISETHQEIIHELVLRERQHEFFVEWGHRWIDINRMGFSSDLMPQVLEDKAGLIWEDHKKIWPIPLLEIDRNKNLLQNPGYN